MCVCYNNLCIEGSGNCLFSCCVGGMLNFPQLGVCVCVFVCCDDLCIGVVIIDCFLVLCWWDAKFSKELCCVCCIIDLCVVLVEC